MSANANSKYTRVQIVSPEGNIEVFAGAWDVCTLDEGRTLKLIAKGTPDDAHKARRARRNNLADDLAVISRVAARHRHHHH